METLWRSAKFEVARIRVPDRTGGLHDRDIVVHCGAVVVLPLLPGNRCVMIRQWRPAIQRELWELPAGTLDVRGEDPREAAARELIEETGYRAGRLEWLCRFYPSPGIMTERIDAFVADELTAVGQDLEPTERIEPVPMPLGEALEMVADGRIVDAKTIIALTRFELVRRPAR